MNKADTIQQFDQEHGFDITTEEGVVRLFKYLNNLYMAVMLFSVQLLSVKELSKLVPLQKMYQQTVMDLQPRGKTYKVRSWIEVLCYQLTALRLKNNRHAEYFLDWMINSRSSEGLYKVIVMITPNIVDDEQGQVMN